MTESILLLWLDESLHSKKVESSSNHLWQTCITFVMLNRFVHEAKRNHPPVLYEQYQMKNIYLFYIAFQVLKVLLIKIFKIYIQPSDLLFLFGFISRYHFSQIFRTSFNNIWKKYFHHRFSFFNRFAQTQHPHSSPHHLLNNQNPLW